MPVEKATLGEGVSGEQTNTTTITLTHPTGSSEKLAGGLSLDSTANVDSC